MLDELSSAVAELMSAACEELVLPRFRRLASDEIETKSGPNDLVTVADRQAELFLTPRLLDLVDGEVIGEEACASDPGLRARADAPVAWTVDPVDGTGNFVAGDERFCCMVALMNHGVPVKSWILFPLQRRLFIASAEKGAVVMEEGGDLKQAGNSEPGLVPRRTFRVGEYRRSFRAAADRGAAEAADPAGTMVSEMRRLSGVGDRRRPSTVPPPQPLHAVGSRACRSVVP